MNEHYKKRKTQAVLFLKMQELAEKYNLTYDEIETICHTPYEFMRVKAFEANKELGEFPTTKIPGFMTFFVKKGKKEWFKQKYKDINNGGEEVLHTDD